MERATEKRKRSSSPEVRFRLVSISPTIKRHSSSDKQLQSSSKRLFSELPFVISSPPQSPLPLTTRNLQLLDPTMAPSKNETSESKDTTASTASKSKDPAFLLQVLKSNRQFKWERIDAAKFPAVKAYVDSIVNRRRNSVLSEEKRTYLLSERFRREATTVNETTFMQDFWSEMFDKYRNPSQRGTPMDPGEQAALSKVRWSSDGLGWRGDERFTTESIPQLAASKAELEKVYAQLPKMQCPQPDHAYGFDSEAFSAREQTLNVSNKEVTGLQPTCLWHIFFVAEWKQSDGDLAVAEIQALRGGSAVVNAMHNFRVRAGEPEHTAAMYNLDIAFSFTIDPHNGYIWVHWFDAMESNFHMGKYHKYDIESDEGLIKLHHDIDNIMDWGLDERLTAVKWLLGELDKRPKAAPKSTQK